VTYRDESEYPWYPEHWIAYERALNRDPSDHVRVILQRCCCGWEVRTVEADLEAHWNAHIREGS
jgi:hypothetical protein